MISRNLHFALATPSAILRVFRADISRSRSIIRHSAFLAPLISPSPCRHLSAASVWAFRVRWETRKTRDKRVEARGERSLAVDFATTCSKACLSLSDNELSAEINSQKVHTSVVRSVAGHACRARTSLFVTHVRACRLRAGLRPKCESADNARQSFLTNRSPCERGSRYSTRAIIVHHIVLILPGDLYVAFTGLPIR